MSKTREQRRQCRDVIRRVALTALGLLVAAAMIWLLTSCDPADEIPKTARERAAEFAAQERYYELLDRGWSEWSAREAANFGY